MDKKQKEKQVDELMEKKRKANYEKKIEINVVKKKRKTT